MLRRNIDARRDLVAWIGARVRGLSRGDGEVEVDAAMARTERSVDFVVMLPLFALSLAPGRVWLPPQVPRHVRHRRWERGVYEERACDTSHVNDP